MKIMMQLLSDAVFGNGMSIPGGEDIAVLTDGEGFPYYKGSTLKGIFRETYLKLLELEGRENSDIEKELTRCLGASGDDTPDDNKWKFSDMKIPAAVKTAVLSETGHDPDGVLSCMSHLRTFTAIDEDGGTENGSLRMARCVNQGLWFEGEIMCGADEEERVLEVLGLIKWIGRMRNRGFGKVRFEKKEARG